MSQKIGLMAILGGVCLSASAALPKTPVNVVLTESPPAVPCSGGNCVYDPGQYSSGTTLGLTAGEALGHRIVLADLDKDNNQDIIIAAPDYDKGRGMVYVVYGNTNGPKGVLDLSLPSVIKLKGPDGAGHFGTSIAAGDLTGDNIADLVISAPTLTGPLVYVIPGALGIRLAQPIGDITTVLSAFTLTAPSSGSEFGASIALGDVTSSGSSANDGKIDLVIGAPSEDTAYLAYGPITKSISFTDKTRVIRFLGGGGDRAGAFVGVLRDLDTVGIPELVVGAPDADKTGGRLYLFDGRGRTSFDITGSGTVDLNSNSLNKRRTFVGDLKYAGNVVGALGTNAHANADLNADGKADLLFGVPYAPTTDSQPEVGRVYVIAGSSSFYNNSSTSLSSSSLAFFRGDTPGDHFGMSLNSAGDVDRDGFADFWVGASDATFSTGVTKAGVAYLLVGRAASQFISNMKPDGMRFIGRLAGDLAGSDIGTASVTDLDKDGYTDVLVGAPGTDGSSGTDNGRIFYLSMGDFFDKDGDGQTRAAGDCDESSPSNFFRTSGEVCDGVDNDCDGLVDLKDSRVEDAIQVYVDRDNDGYGDATATAQDACPDDIPSGSVSNNQDCNDGNRNISPSAQEICDTIDNDCDSLVDGKDPSVSGINLYRDEDLDGYGSVDSETFVGCANQVGAGLSSTNDDCDDASAEIHPAAEEVCDGLDNNCNRLVDDDDDTIFDATDPGFVTSYPDGDNDGFGDSSAPHESCEIPTGFLEDGTDCNDKAVNTHPGAAEGQVFSEPLQCLFPDGTDNDCDGITDEGTCSSDDDGDGASETGGDCDDTDPGFSPFVLETCDGKDNDCDGSIDDGFDQDQDGQLSAALCKGQPGATDCDDTNASISQGAPVLCDGKDTDCDGKVPDAGISSEQDNDNDSVRACEGDCNDALSEVYPGAPELCDGKDNNCNEIIDEILDDDEDGFSQCNDCDDADAATYPEAPELCDGKDNDCDGELPSTGDDGEVDTDEDGFFACDGDCLDTNPEANPNEEEVCDEVDNDCNGDIDDNPSDISIFYLDRDGDGFGDGTEEKEACEAPPKYVEFSGDCNDNLASVHPGATEICDGLDNNCDNTQDEDILSFDRDEDGYLDATQCQALEGSLKLDCDDLKPGVNPGTEEVPNDGLDNDCDGEALVTTDPSPLPDILVSDALSCACDQRSSGRSAPSGGQMLMSSLLLLGCFWRARRR